MTLLVKNEEDTIETNIRFHADQGVDAFIVMDNGSTDATPEILKILQKEYDLTVVHNASTAYKQSEWMTGMARQARRELGADLVISNDADEFWSTHDGSSLKSKLTSQESVVTVRRYNFILDEAQGEDRDGYVHCSNRVINPILYTSQEYEVQKKLSMPLQRIAPKVIVNPVGLLHINGGNHRAKHIMFWRNRVSEDIVVDHYPILSYRNFEKKIQSRQIIRTLHPERRLNVHYRRWLASLDSGELRQEYRQMLVNEKECEVLQRFGVIEQVKPTALARWHAAR
ncbi:glycosyltransferase family 2 protein [Hylemonella gracilis]|nr:glycosyltransferase family 2 protein [Hylemonella gracilis]